MSGYRLGPPPVKKMPRTRNSLFSQDKLQGAGQVDICLAGGSLAQPGRDRAISLSSAAVPVL
jgi:hypothetical protein